MRLGLAACTQLPFARALPAVHSRRRPKPNHYLQYLTSGKCAFRDLCALVSFWMHVLCGVQLHGGEFDAIFCRAGHH